MLRRVLVGIAMGVGLVVGMSATAGAATLPPTLTGEKLAQNKTYNGSGPACLFDGYQLSEASTFCASGTATGPYPGTFNETGTYSTVSTDPSSNPDQDFGNVTVYTVTFTIKSAVGQVTGSEKLDPTKMGTYTWNAGIGGFTETVTAHTDYTATILSNGGAYADAGTTVASVDQGASGVAGTTTIGIKDLFSSSGTSVTLITPPPAPPGLVSAPGIGGSFVQGQTLNESHGVWSGSPFLYGYQWERCDASGANCSDIAGQSASSYLLTSADAGMTLRVLEWATNGVGTGGPAMSAATPVIQALLGPPPPTPSPSGSTPPISTSPITPFRLVIPARLAIPGLLRQGGYTWAITAPKRGRLVVTWTRGATLIAAGSNRFARSGRIDVRIHLTAAGRRLLRTHRSLRVTSKATYTPAGGLPVSVTRVVRLLR